MLGPQGLAGGAKQLGDRLVRSENEADELERNPTDRTLQRFLPLGEAPLAPREQRRRSLFGDRRHRLILAEGGSSVRQVMLPPAGGEEASVAHHLEVFVGDVADQTADEGKNRKGLVRGLTALCVVPVGKPHEAFSAS